MHSAHNQTSLEVVSAHSSSIIITCDCHLHLLKVSILILCIIVCQYIYFVCVY